MTTRRCHLLLRPSHVHHASVVAHVVRRCCARCASVVRPELCLLCIHSGTRRTSLLHPSYVRCCARCADVVWPELWPSYVHSCACRASVVASVVHLSLHLSLCPSCACCRICCHIRHQRVSELRNGCLGLHFTPIGGRDLPLLLACISQTMTNGEVVGLP